MFYQNTQSDMLMWRDQIELSFIVVELSTAVIQQWLPDQVILESYTRVCSAESAFNVHWIRHINDYFQNVIYVLAKWDLYMPQVSQQNFISVCISSILFLNKDKCVWLLPWFIKQILQCRICFHYKTHFSLAQILKYSFNYKIRLKYLLTKIPGTQFIGTTGRN